MIFAERSTLLYRRGLIFHSDHNNFQKAQRIPSCSLKKLIFYYMALRIYQISMDYVSKTEYLFKEDDPS